MTAALAFTLTCPKCGDLLDYVASSIPKPMAATATMRCPACGLSWSARVTLAITAGARRFDFDALEAQIGSDINVLARRLNVDRTMIYHYRQRGLSCKIADQLATRLNLHPAHIWPSWWDTNEGVNA